jgi:CDP-diacylglycerol--serine O-phosphatidyltransferase
MKGHPWNPIIYVSIAAFFDLMDGFFARMLKVNSEFGKQLDSLADMVSFGVLPALVLVNLHPSYFAIGLLVAPFSALRLAKFNLSANQENEFRGLPTPANAILICSIAAFKFDFLMPYINIVSVSAFAISSSLLLVSDIRLVAFKFKTFGWQGNQIRWVILGLISFGFIIFQLSFLPFVIPTYIVVSIAGNYLWRRGVS